MWQTFLFSLLFFFVPAATAEVVFDATVSTLEVKENLRRVCADSELIYRRPENRPPLINSVYRLSASAGDISLR